MNRQLRFLQFYLRRLGLLGGLGLALSVAALFYALILVPKREAERETLSKEIAHLQADRVVLETRIQQSTLEKVGKGTRLEVSMPTAADTPQLLLTLEDIARQNQLQIKHNDYRYVEPLTPRSGKDSVVKEDSKKMVEVKISTPTSGSYHSVRSFIAEALQRIPTLALDDLSLKRDAIDKSEIQTQLRFTLFVRSET